MACRRMPRRPTVSKSVWMSIHQKITARIPNAGHMTEYR